jgi:uncharacterized protein
VTSSSPDPLPLLEGAGISVIEAPAGEEPILLRPETVTAFIGPAPRGPAHIPVAIESVAEFRRRFGSPARRSRLEWVLAQYFENGGKSAIIVRVAPAGSRTRMALPGPGGALELAALHPGPLEYLRAAVDFDGIPADDLWRFNLTLQRIRSPSNPLVEEQEFWPAVSIAPDDHGFVGDVLAASSLVRMAGEAPRARPYVTPGATGLGPVGYVAARADARAPAAPTDYDLVGSAEECTGLHALDLVARVDLVCLLSGSPGADVGPVALYAAERYCARRNAVLLLDPPLAWTRVEDVARSRRGAAFESPNMMTYFPRLTETAPDGQSVGVRSALGAIAGMLAARDRSVAPATGASAEAPRGLAPDPGSGAAMLFRSRARVAFEADPEESALLASRGVNVLKPAAPGFVSFTGDVTLAAGRGSRREWRWLSVRRRAVMTASSIAHSTRWAAVQAAGPDTWNAVKAQLDRYLADAEAAGLLAGDGHRRAFYVRCDQDTNARGGGLSFVVGLALSAPGDFVAFRFDHAGPDCRVTEVAWQPGPGHGTA